jgi:fructoselysine-6-P-deglycase FrlB-like protein
MGGEAMTFIEDEIASQPECWALAGELAGSQDLVGLPDKGERVAVIGCGTSLYMAQAYAGLREAAGHGETDAWAASEFPSSRHYDRVFAITRSGTSTEILSAFDRASAPTTVLTTDRDMPAARMATHAVVLPFADERSVVQTRFATTALAFLRAHLGDDVASLVTSARAALNDDLPIGAIRRTQFTFLGAGWTVGLANEAALKLREAAQCWAESYPVMEYRHGPVSISDQRSLVWVFGRPPAGLVDQIAMTGASLHMSTMDPMVELVRVHRLAVALAGVRGLDPDSPRHLGRSVILD